MILMLLSGAWGKAIHEKNLKQKISRHCLFKLTRLISGCYSESPPFGPIEEYKWFFTDFQTMIVSEEPDCIYLFRQYPVFTSQHLKSLVYVVPPLVRQNVVSVTGSKAAPLHCSGRKEDDMVITIIIEMFHLHFPF